MAHETPTIVAERRERIGSRYAKRLRASGRLPAVIYGHNQDPVHVSVDEKETLRYLHEGAHVVNIEVDGAAKETCLFKELQFGYLGDNIIHLDFSRIDLDEEVYVSVSLEFKGEPAAAKVPGAVLSTNLSDLEIVCKASDIPHHIEVDISHVEDVLTIAELQLPPGVRCELDADTPVVSITFVEEEAEGEEVEVIGEEEPEVITEARDEGAEDEDGDAEEKD